MNQSLVIHRPVRSSRLTQRFGESKACKYPSGKIVSKKGNVCPLGSISFYESIGLKGHNGHDIATLHGEMVYHGATFDGWMKVEKDEEGGIGVDVVSKQPIYFKGKPPMGLNCEYVDEGGFSAYVKMRYWHLKSAIGYDGKDVVFGQPIGLADNTGSSSGDHLHWSPKWCRKDGSSQVEHNGFYGAFDPSPYYKHHVFAGETPKFLKMPVPDMTAQEKKEIASQLSTLTKLLLTARELLYKL